MARVPDRVQSDGARRGGPGPGTRERGNGAGRVGWEAGGEEDRVLVGEVGRWR